MASQEVGRAGFSSAIVVARSAGSGLGRLGGAWRVLHEDRGLLGKVWVYSMRRGDSGSTHNPWPVHPYPCGVGRPERARVGAGVESVPLGPCAGADEAGGVRICREDPGPGYASGPVSTQRTSVSPPSMSPAGIPRNSAVLARLVGACAVLMSAPWTPAPARPFSSARRRIQDDQPYRGFPPERVSQVT